MCTEEKLSLSLEGAAIGGIIYIKGHGSACKQDTTNTTTYFEFIFNACGVDPYVPFIVVVQKKPHYQTGYDLTVPVLCLYEINVGNQINAEDVDNEGINKTVRPTATMIFYSNGQEVTSGQVDLTDTLTMSIQLGSEYMDDFDLKARHCTANTIELVQDFCSTDTVLFPNFVHPLQGLIASTFGAFRTTDLNGGSVDMTFSCTLKLCYGACPQTDCSGGETVLGRRKRLADGAEDEIIEFEHNADTAGLLGTRKKRSADDDDTAFGSMNVGAVVSVGHTRDITNTDDSNHQFCVHVGFLVISGALFCFVIVIISFSMTSLVSSYREQTGTHSKPEVVEYNNCAFTTKEKRSDSETPTETI
ncbi:uncharacterized protein [Argopecten irradians]|uniref:uncharacterized protein n=1 Tax=Argopecten irradians TaxID=31199 RepID=UPI00371F5273